MNNYLTVSELTLHIKSLIESDGGLMSVMVLGEITSLTNHYTGHFYFSLSDENALIKCAMFAFHARKVNFPIKNGDLVLVKGTVGVYEKSGQYQLYVTEMFPYGEGEYLLKLALLKKKLAEEGILSKPKKPLPFLPKKIGLITAKKGAAIHDFLTTLKNRFKVEVYIFPALVQGENAPNDIIRAIDESENFPLDVLVITRGGGGKEDLRVFNDEGLIRRCYQLKIPLISAIGHEIDTTLLDYVSDCKAITPTDAANKVVPSKGELMRLVKLQSESLDNSLEKRYRLLSEKIAYLMKFIESKSPKNILLNLQSDISHLDDKQTFFMKSILQRKYNSYLNAQENLHKLMIERIRALLTKINSLNDKLTYLDPFSLLESGYSVIIKNNKVITSINEIKNGDLLDLELKDGLIKAEVKEKVEKNGK